MSASVPAQPRENVQVLTPPDPPRLTPSTARLLVALLREHQGRLSDAQDRLLS